MNGASFNIPLYGLKTVVGSMLFTSAALAFADAGHGWLSDALRKIKSQAIPEFANGCCTPLLHSLLTDRLTSSSSFVSWDSDGGEFIGHTVCSAVICRSYGILPRLYPLAYAFGQFGRGAVDGLPAVLDGRSRQSEPGNAQKASSTRAAIAR